MVNERVFLYGTIHVSPGYVATNLHTHTHTYSGSDVAVPLMGLTNWCKVLLACTTHVFCVCTC